jgi:hypothetical protein
MLSRNPAAAKTAGSVGPDGPATLRHDSPVNPPPEMEQEVRRQCAPIKPPRRRR